MYLFLAVLWVGVQSLIVAFPSHTQLIFDAVDSVKKIFVHQYSDGIFHSYKLNKKS